MLDNTRFLEDLIKEVHKTRDKTLKEDIEKADWESKKGVLLSVSDMISLLVSCTQTRDILRKLYEEERNKI